ncbi:MAG: hypothetical protein ACTSU2_13010 [Promethearchaeota archaeon]
MQLIEEGKLFTNRKFIFRSIVILLILSVVISLSFDIPRVVGKSFSIIRLRDKYLGEWDWDPWFNLITFFIGIFTAIFILLLFSKYNRLKKNKEPSLLRDLLSYTLFFTSLSVFNESLYILFDSDFTTLINAAGEFYIILNILTVNILIYISKTIFFSEKEYKGFMVKNLDIISVTIYFMAYFFMMLFSINETLFQSAIIIAFLFILVQIILAMSIIIKIFQLRSYISKYKDALTSIAIILLLMIISILFLIGCGLTSDEIPINQFPNRLFRFIRIIIFLVVGYLYYPAFIKPIAKTKK